ncbi:hypothetical protein J6590_069419 [Homalodisca vitripennis]|nr:hypothetical protein J6590_069419 [Homalodisca vitripennis]
MRRVMCNSPWYGDRRQLEELAKWPLDVASGTGPLRDRLAKEGVGFAAFHGASPAAAGVALLDNSSASVRSGLISTDQVYRQPSASDSGSPPHCSQGRLLFHLLSIVGSAIVAIRTIDDYRVRRTLPHVQFKSRPG